MTNRDPGWLQAHANGEDDWKRWEESPIQQVDFAVHIHYLHKYLQGNMRVLEIGAGAGRFTKELADISNRIVVADISPSKLQRNKRNAEALGYADAVEEWCECDMLNLHPNFGDGEFDAVVCYGGPLSYVFDRREKAIRELVRVTRPGGTLCLSAKSLWGTVHAFLPTILNVDPRLNREIVETGDMGPDKVDLASRFWHAYRASEFKEFIEQAGAIVEVLSASDCLSATWRDLLYTWRDDKKRWEHLLELEIEACREPGCVDMGAYVLAVAKKL
jgi:ubiquinone/menaquinone biosynthesis C-methylase UbiE